MDVADEECEAKLESIMAAQRRKLFSNAFKEAMLRRVNDLKVLVDVGTYYMCVKYH